MFFDIEGRTKGREGTGREWRGGEGNEREERKTL